MEDNELKPMEDLNSEIQTNDYQSDYTEELDLGEINIAGENYITNSVEGELDKEEIKPISEDLNIDENNNIENNIEIEPVESVQNNDESQDVYNDIPNEVEIQELNVDDTSQQNIFDNNVINPLGINDGDQTQEIESISYETKQDDLESQPDYNSYVISEELLNNDSQVDPVLETTKMQETDVSTDSQSESFDVKSMFEGVTVPEPEPVNVIDNFNIKNEEKKKEKTLPQPIVMAEHPNGKIKLNFDKEEEKKEEENINPSDIKLDIRGNKSLLYVVVLGLIILVIIFLLPFFA